MTVPAEDLILYCVLLLLPVLYLFYIISYYKKSKRELIADEKKKESEARVKTKNFEQKLRRKIELNSIRFFIMYLIAIVLAITTNLHRVVVGITSVSLGYFIVWFLSNIKIK